MPQDAQEGEFAQWRPQTKVAGGWGISSKQCGGWADRGEEEEHLGMAKATVLHQAGGAMGQIFRRCLFWRGGMGGWKIAGLKWLKS